MNIPKGYKLVPVEPSAEMLRVTEAIDAETFYRGEGEYELCNAGDYWGAMLAAAPTPPQPIFDEASERDSFDAEYEKICCRTGITIREIAWRIWQSRAKAGEDE